VTADAGPRGVPEAIAGLAREVSTIVRRTTGDPRYRVLLFGSWASGEAGERSDVDLGILGPAPLDPAVLAAVREACDALPTLRSVDLVDLADAPAPLREAALAGGVEVAPR
jgi:predicted nucleotidyltransferase